MGRELWGNGLAITLSLSPSILPSFYIHTIVSEHLIIRVPVKAMPALWLNALLLAPARVGRTLAKTDIFHRAMDNAGRIRWQPLVLSSTDGKLWVPSVQACWGACLWPIPSSLTGIILFLMFVFWLHVFFIWLGYWGFVFCRKYLHGKHQGKI